MIHDARIEVTCDGRRCAEAIDVYPHYVYFDYSGKSGKYEDSDEVIEELIEKEEWIVKDGKHYCCKECAGGEEDEN